MDLLIRGATLCDSLHNSSSITDHKSWNDQDAVGGDELFPVTKFATEILMSEVDENED